MKNEEAPGLFNFLIFDHFRKSTKNEKRRSPGASQFSHFRPPKKIKRKRHRTYQFSLFRLLLKIDEKRKTKKPRGFSIFSFSTTFENRRKMKNEEAPGLLNFHIFDHFRKSTKNEKRRSPGASQFSHFRPLSKI